MGRSLAKPPLKRLATDRRGVSAIEFTLIFPILVAIFAGTVDFGQTLLVSRKMNQIVSTVGDIVSQNGSWNSQEATALLNGAASLIQPYDINDLSIELVVLDVDSEQGATVRWAVAVNGDASSSGKPSPQKLPTDMAIANEQLILVRASFGLATAFSNLLAPITGHDKYIYDRFYFVRPRVPQTVTLD